MLYSLFWDLVDLFFPPTCGGCGELGVKWCEKCQHQTKIVPAPICEKCGQTILNTGLCKRCANESPMTTSAKDNQWAIDIVIAVPLGRKREQQRGYNQAALLAKPLVLALQIPYNPHILRRVKETRSQVDLSLVERKRNMPDALQAHQEKVVEKRILVVDDVTTTGSTIDACASALTKVGAKPVYGLTVARAVLAN